MLPNLTYFLAFFCRLLLTAQPVDILEASDGMESGNGWSDIDAVDLINTSVTVSEDHPDAIPETSMTDTLIKNLESVSQHHRFLSNTRGTTASHAGNVDMAGTATDESSDPVPGANMTPVSAATRASILQLNGCLLTERTSWYNYDRSAAAVDLALQYANEIILKPIGMNLMLTYRDLGSDCLYRNPSVVIAMDLLSTGVHCDAFIGAGCTYNYENLYDLSEFLRIPFIGVPAAGVGTKADPGDYDNMVRLSITHINTIKVVMNFLRKFNYTSPTIIADMDIPFNSEMDLIMERWFRMRNPTLFAATNFNEINSTTLTTDNITDSLKDAMAVSRFIVLITNATTTRQIMLVAQQMGLTNGDYVCDNFYYPIDCRLIPVKVFMAFELFPSESWGAFTWKKNDDFDQAAKRAYRTLLLLSLAPEINAAFDVFSDQVKKLSAVRTTNSYQYGKEEQVDLITAHFYDAIVFYASMVRDTFINGSDIFSIETFINVTGSGYTFTSPVDGVIILDENGDRVCSYVIRSLNTRTGLFEPAFSISSSDPNNITPLGVMSWPNRDNLPPNAPYCGYDGKALRCAPKPISKGNLAAAAVIPTVFVLILLAILYQYIRKLIHKSQDPFWWCIYAHELTNINAARAVSMANSSVHSKSINDEIKSKKADLTTLLDHDEPLKLSFVLYGKTATFHEITVALRDLPEPLQRISSASNNDFFALRTVKHTNLQDFYGVAINDHNLCEYVVGENCQKGSLMALLEKTTMTLDWPFKHSLMKGITNGMMYLHSSKVMTHGDLSAHTLLIDSRFVIKISDYGLAYFRPVNDLVPPDEDDEDRDFAKLLWRAPELLRRPVQGGTQKGDVYSFGILLQQLILRSAPYESSIDSRRPDYHAHAKELITEIKRGANPPQRPVVPVSSCPTPLFELLELCWDEHPILRITFAKVRDHLQKALGKSGENVIEHLINRMDLYATELENEAHQKMVMYLAEKQRTEDLLRGMLPKTIGDRLRRGDMVGSEFFQDVTIQFSDVGGFSEILKTASTAYATISMVNSICGQMDHVIEEFDAYKVEALADRYIIVSGLPTRNGDRHVSEMAGLALTLRKELNAVTFPTTSDMKLRLRAGLHTGPCIASIIGAKMPRYCVFGEALLIASCLMTSGDAGKIQISPATHDLLEKSGEYFTMPREGSIAVTGTKVMETFWLVAKTSV